MSPPKQNLVGWFEVPVENMQRAITFYETVFHISLQRHTLETCDMAWFPSNAQSAGASGSLVFHPERYKPSTSGVLIYFSSPSGDLETELSRVESAGGKVILEKKLISAEVGYMGACIDTEGNRIALHSKN